jgi:hypothetical protein
VTYFGKYEHSSQQVGKEDALPPVVRGIEPSHRRERGDGGDGRGATILQPLKGAPVFCIPRPAHSATYGEAAIAMPFGLAWSNPSSTASCGSSFALKHIKR